VRLAQSTLPREIRSLWIAATVAAVPTAVVLFLFNPLEVRWYPRCPLYVLTGFYCPGCGALRAGHALLHGHLVTALGYNPLLVLSLPVLAYVAAAEWTQAVTGRVLLPTRQLSGREARMILYVIVAYMVLRNIPVYPFSILAP
jgi:hypothetical protein